MGAQNEEHEEQEQEKAAIEAVGAILTLPNLISFLRLCLVPIFLIYLLREHDIIATVLFAVAAVSDFLDGLIARRTRKISRVGQLLDPAVDRILMIAGILGIYLVGRIPLWVILVIFARELCQLIVGIVLMARYRIRIPVVYPGKVATTFLFIGFVGLLLNWPLISGLGICDFSWLPGFNFASVSLGIWFIYAGMLLALGVTVYYAIEARKRLREVRKDRDGHSEKELDQRS